MKPGPAISTRSTAGCAGNASSSAWAIARGGWPKARALTIAALQAKSPWPGSRLRSIAKAVGGSARPRSAASAARARSNRSWRVSFTGGDGAFVRSHIVAGIVPGHRRRVPAAAGRPSAAAARAAVIELQP